MSSSTKTAALVVAFLAALATANLVVAHYGQIALVFTAWVLIPFDMVTRDLLHERWRGHALLVRMGLLIAAGALLAVALNLDAWRVAIASCLAFAMAMGINAVVFEALVENSSRYVRMNLSNLFASITDSVIFPVVAFGIIDVSLSAAQAGSKFAGGLVWSAIAIWLTRKKTIDVRDDS